MLIFQIFYQSDQTYSVSFDLCEFINHFELCCCVCSQIAFSTLSMSRLLDLSFSTARLTTLLARGETPTLLVLGSTFMIPLMEEMMLSSLWLFKLRSFKNSSSTASSPPNALIFYSMWANLLPVDRKVGLLCRLVYSRLAVLSPRIFSIFSLDLSERSIDILSWYFSLIW